MENRTMTEGESGVVNDGEPTGVRPDSDAGHGAAADRGRVGAAADPAGGVVAVTGPEQHADLRGVEGVTVGPLNIQPVSGPPTPGGPKPVTGPEQHAATVRKCHADAMMALAADVHPYSAEAVRQQEEALDAALGELVALAGRADELQRKAEEYRTSLVSQTTYREAAEARADELQRERDVYKDASRQRYGLLIEAERDLEQARREADQLRAALRTVCDWVRDGIGTESEAAEVMDAALAGPTSSDGQAEPGPGVQADKQPWGPDHPSYDEMGQ